MKHISTRRSIVVPVLAASVVVLAACSATTKDSPSGVSTANHPSTVSTAPDTSPLTVGITYIDNSASEASLGAKQQQVTSKALANAFVRALNASGGVGGRKIIPVTYTFNAQDANYSTDASAACAKFTQDNHVSVVLDTAFGSTGGFGDCLEKAGVFSITTQQEGDQASSEQAKLHVNVMSPTLDRTYSAVLQGSVADGYLGPDNQLGIVLEGCPDNQHAYSHTIQPLVAKLNLKAPKVEQVGCTSGFASASAAAAALASATLAFRQAHVDRLMFVSYYESVLLALFAPGAAAQKYTPGYLLSSAAQPVVALSSIPSSQWPQLHGVGNEPFNDVNNPQATATDKRCFQLATTGGVGLSSNTDRDLAVSLCGPFLLLDTALQRTHGNASPAELAATIAGLGTSFSAPGLVDGSAEFTATRHDAPNAYRPFAYRAACKCLEYVGSARPLS